MKNFRVIAKINAKDEEALKDIKFCIEEMVSCIPAKVGNYWIYGMTPIEFKKMER